MEESTIYYPLLFRYQDFIAREDLIVNVDVSGRAFIYRDEDDWWMSGVKPCAMMERGETIDEATAAFRAMYRNVLADFFDGAQSFNAFKDDPERFFNQHVAEYDDIFAHASAKLRSGELVIDHPFFKSLPQRKSETRQPNITIVRIQPDPLQPSVSPANKTNINQIKLTQAMAA